MSSKGRRLCYSHAINEALHQTMEADTSVILIGQGVKSPWYVGDTAKGLIERFGEKRIIDTPISENAITGAAVGAAISGMRAVVVHPRMDFMLFAFDPIINQAANWHYMSGGKVSVPAVIWGIVNRGGEQAAQHSQALHAMFSHVPGLKVVMPSTAYDAKGLMVAAIRDDNPVIFIDDRWLYNTTDEVPKELYSVPIGKGVIRRKGNDLTIVAASYPALAAIEAADALMRRGIKAEVIDLRSIKPVDYDLVCRSVKKTGLALVIDGGWRTCGFAAEISASINENVFNYLKAPVKRLTLPDCPAPASRTLEEAFFINKDDIVASAVKLLRKNHRIYKP